MFPFVIFISISFKLMLLGKISEGRPPEDGILSTLSNIFVPKHETTFRAASLLLSAPFTPV